MAVIGDKGTWKVSNQATRAAKGPLIRVKTNTGATVKMYEADAIEAGYLPPKKSAPAPANKIAPMAPDNKATLPPDAPPDDFTTIKGVGKASARSLVAQGVTTFAALRSVDMEALSLPKTVRDAVEAWRE